MTRTHNRMDIVSELHDTQMVAALFQLPTELCSEYLDKFYRDKSYKVIAKVRS